MSQYHAIPVATARPAASIQFTPASDQSKVNHLRITIESIHPLPDGGLHMAIVCGELGFDLCVPPSPQRPDFAVGQRYTLEYPKGQPMLDCQYTAIYPAELKPEQPSQKTEARSVTMSHSMTPFQFDSHIIRAANIHNEPWFVGKDIALALGYSNPQKAVRDHCKNPKAAEGVNESFTPTLDPQTIIISEPDVLRLIIGSKLPAAEQFERWVFEEVLPTIRKTGSYQAAPSHAPALPDFTNPAIAARAWAEQFEQREVETQRRITAEAERDTALRTKAQIGSKREAVAMARASAAARENARLRDALGQSSQFATVRAVERVADITVGQRWRDMRKWCADHDIQPKEAPDSLYGMVKAWPAGAWHAVFGIKLAELFPAASVQHA